MTLLLDGRPDGTPVRGSQTPRIFSVPPAASVETGREVIELCQSVGMDPDEAQQLAIRSILAEDAAGGWAALEGCVVEPRQNGKGDVLMALEVGGLFLLEEELIIHTAHEFKTCAEGFLRVCTLIENSDYLRRRAKKPRLTTGQESIELLNGNRLKFMARSGSSGRGFTAKRVILDEAQILSDAPIRAMLPTLSAVPNPQIVYTASAGNPYSVQLGAIRRRALAGGDRSLAYLEWSVDEDDYDPADPACWAVANPALGFRISVGYVAKERAAMSAEGFASERLGVGDWPLDDEESRVIPRDRWLECADRRSARPDNLVMFAVEVNPERSSATVAVCGRRPDGMVVVEVADQRAGLEWVVARCAELDQVWRPLGWVVEKGKPGGDGGAAFGGCRADGRVAGVGGCGPVGGNVFRCGDGGPGPPLRRRPVGRGGSGRHQAFGGAGVGVGSPDTELGCVAAGGGVVGVVGVPVAGRPGARSR